MRTATNIYFKMRAVFVLLGEFTESDTIGTNAQCLGVFSTLEKLLDFFITYLLRNHAYDICTEEEIDSAAELNKDPVCSFDSKFPACLGEHVANKRRYSVEDKWTKDELIQHLKGENGAGDHEYEIGSMIYSWSEHNVDEL